MQHQLFELGIFDNPCLKNNWVNTHKRSLSVSLGTLFYMLYVFLCFLYDPLLKDLIYNQLVTTQYNDLIT